MAHLIPIKNDQVEVLIDPATGESFVTISGYARLSGKSRQAVSQRLRRFPAKEALVPAEMGSRVKLLSEATVAEWLQKDNPSKARRMAQAGVRVFLHQMAGYKVSSSFMVAQAPQPAPTKPPSAGQMLVAMAQAFMEVEGRVGAIESKVEALEAEAGQYRDYSTIKGYCRKLGVKPLSPAWAQGQGKEAKRLTLASGLEIREAPDPTYGTVGSYPNSVLETMTWPLPQQYRLSEGPLSLPFE